MASNKPEFDTNDPNLPISEFPDQPNQTNPKTSDPAPIPIPTEAINQPPTDSPSSSIDTPPTKSKHKQIFKKAAPKSKNPSMDRSDPANTKQTQTDSKSTPKSQKPKKPHFVFIALTILAVLGAGGVAAAPYAYKIYQQARLGQLAQFTPGFTKAQLPPTPQPSANPTSTPKPSPSTRPSADLVLGTLTFSTPTPTNTPDIFPSDINPGLLNPDESTFTQIATDENGTLLNAQLSSGEFMGGYLNLRLYLSDTGDTTVIVPTNHQQTATSYDKFFLPQVKFAFLDIPELTPPDTIQTDSQTYKLTRYDFLNFDTLSTPQLLTQSDSGPLYRIDKPIADDSPILSRQIVLKLPDATYADYYYQDPSVSDSHRPQITFSNPQDFGEAFFEKPMFPSGVGFGTGASIVLKSSTANSYPKESIGTTDSGQTVYQFTTTNPIIQALYDDLYLATGAFSEPITIDEFLTSQSHVFWQDQLGDYQLYVNNQFAPAVEMAKPVIYLYPESTQPVHVQIAADITQSDPHYPQNGWHITAHPTGEINYQSQTYPYLFWEGMGHGHYPSTEGIGVVVPQSQLIPTLKSHLTKLGLNQSESADFLVFWTQHLPTTPYVRLTWLLTPELDQLAPLTVTPKPDTIIRIFLEFQGLDHPIDLTPQNLSAPARSGFTLIEWGGLLYKPHL